MSIPTTLRHSIGTIDPSSLATAPSHGLTLVLVLAAALLPTSWYCLTRLAPRMVLCKDAVRPRTSFFHDYLCSRSPDVPRLLAGAVFAHHAASSCLCSIAASASREWLVLWLLG